MCKYDFMWITEVKIEMHMTFRIDYSCGLTLFDMGGGGMIPPKKVFDHCAQTLMRKIQVMTS